MAEVTKPILLDETGQEIKAVLLGIKTAIQNQSGGGGGGGAGVDGFSPVATVEQTDTGAVITITDKTGTTTATVNHGADGAPGPAYELTEPDKQEMVAAVVASVFDGIKLKDRVAGTEYTLYVSNGKLMMEV